MSNVLRKGRNIHKTANVVLNPVGAGIRKGLGSSNTLGQLADTSGAAWDNLDNAYESGGTDAALDAIKRGDITDPGGLFHKRGAPDQVPEPVKATTGEPEAQKARDRIRKRIYKAQGRQSTIRAGNAFGQFNGQQTQLLGS